MTNQAVIPAFETDDVQQARRTARSVRLSYEPVEGFRAELRDMQERSRDLLVPYDKLRVFVKEEDHFDANGAYSRYKLMLKIDEVPNDGTLEVALYEHVLGQLCGHTSIGDKAGMPVQYLKRLLSDSMDKGLICLAVANVQELLSRRYGELHTRGKKGEKKAVFLRMFRTDEGLKCRAILSDSYFPIRTLDMVAIALGLATGKIKTQDDGEETAINGAYLFDKHLSVTGCSVGMVNPGFAFDLRNPDRGIIRAESVTHGENGRPVFHYPGGASYALGGQFNFPQDGPKQHLVLPAARISNSETGGGSAEIQNMMFETVCSNGMVGQRAMRRTHIGSIMEEANEFESNETKKKKMETVISMITDTLKQVFSTKNFGDNCLKFLKLKDKELKSDRVQEFTEHLLSAIPGGDGLLDDVMKAYEQFTPGRDSVLDVTRALTNVAQDQFFDKQVAIEELAGALVEGTRTVPEKMLA